MIRRKAQWLRFEQLEARFVLDGAIVQAWPDAFATLEDAPLQVAAPGLLANDTRETTHPEGNETEGNDTENQSGDPDGGDGTSTDENSSAEGSASNDESEPEKPLFVQSFDAVSAQGATVSVAADGSFTYDPTSSASLQALEHNEVVEDTFSYTAADGDGNESTALVTVTVTGITKVKQWDIFEKVLSSTTSYSDSARYRDVTLQATFQGPQGSTTTVPGFWDGGTTWRVRFAPTAPGVWSYTIHSSDAQLDAVANDGGFTAVTPTADDVAANPNYRGFVRVSANNRFLEYADGTPFFWMGDTIWSGNSAAMEYAHDFKALIDNRTEKDFSVVQILVGKPERDDFHWLGYENENGPLFVKQFTEINPANFQLLDQRIQYVVDKGMVPVVFFAWGDSYMPLTVEELKSYFRYIVSRYQAHNVIWSLSGEYGTAYNLPKIRTLGQYVDSINTVDHPTTIHFGTGTGSSSQHFRGESWLDIHMQQSHEGDEHLMMRKDYDLNDGPAVNGESGYDGLWGHDRNRVRREAWAVYTAGGAGYTYGADGIWQWNDGRWDHTSTPRWHNVVDLPSSRDMQRIVQFFAGTNWSHMKPCDHLVNRGYCLADVGREYIVYLPFGGNVSIQDLPDFATSVWFNPRTGEYQAATGPNFQAPDNQDWVLHVTGSLLPIVTVSAPQASASEPNEQGSFLVTRSGEVDEPLVVNLKMGGTATPDVDYQAIRATVTIPAGARSTTITVVPKDDDVQEPNETITLNVSIGSDYVVGSPSNASVTLADDDTPPTAVAEGLLAHWKLDETGGVLAEDSTTHGNDATLVNGPTWTTGYLGGGLTLDGGNDYLSAGKGPAITGKGAFAVAAWVKTPGGLDQVIVQQRSPAAYNGGYVLEVKSTGHVGWWTFGDGAFGFNVRSTSTVRDNEWHHVVGIREEDGTGKIYIDGKLEVVQAAAPRTMNAIDVFVGAETRGMYKFFRGMLDDVRIYERALKEGEIQLLVNPIPAGPVPNRAPTVQAGPDLKITLPEKAVLDGTVTDDGKPDPVTNQWSVVSGPGNVTFANASAVDTTAEFSALGRYVLRLSADDGEFTTEDDVVVDVTPVLPKVSMTVLDATVGEPANAGRVLISRTGETSAAMTVQLMVRGTALNGVDYEKIPETIVIPAGAAEISLDVIPLDDNVAEENETIILAIVSNATYALGSPDSATLTITDNDIPPEPAPVDLLGHWKLDDAQGNKAQDSSGRGNHGTLLNGPVWSTGHQSGALSFDGSNDHVSLGRGPAVVGKGPFAVSAWIKNLGGMGDQVIVQQRSNQAYNGTYVLEVASTGQVGWWTFGDGAFGYHVRSVTQVRDGNWHHVVAVREADGTGRIYIDGKLDASQAAPPRTLGSIDVFFGAETRGMSKFFAGRMDDIRIYGRSLSADEVKQLTASSVASQGEGEIALALTATVLPVTTNTVAVGGKSPSVTNQKAQTSTSAANGSTNYGHATGTSHSTSGSQSNAPPLATAVDSVIDDELDALLDGDLLESLEP